MTVMLPKSKFLIVLQLCSLSLGLGACTPGLYEPCRKSNLFFYDKDLEQSADAVLVGMPRQSRVGPSGQYYVSEIWTVEAIQILKASVTLPRQLQVIFIVHISPIDGDLSGPGSIGKIPTMMILKKHNRLPDPYLPDDPYLTDNADYEIISSATCN